MPTSNAHSVLLDLDGTLVDSAPGILASCRAALAALGHEDETPPDLRTMIGPPIEQAMRDVLARLGDDRTTEAVAAYRDHYGAIGLHATTAYPGIPKALDALVATRARLFVATSKRTVFARRILEALGLADRMAGIFGSEPGGAFDEKPALIAHVVAREGLAAERCVMVGDRRFDIAGARANAMRSIGVTWGYGDRAELKAAGADLLVDRPQDLTAAVAALTDDGAPAGSPPPP